MNRLLIQLSALLCFSLAQTYAQTRIMVISDTHVVAPDNQSLVKNISDNKLDYYSYDILNKAVGNIIKAKPDLLLVCGDLTFFGEKSGHATAHSLLSKVTEVGIPVKVIPGNHDIMDPNSIDDDKANLDAAAFVELYKDMGYETGVERDANSLSWATSINDKLAIIGLDANIYDGTKHYSDGCLRTSTIAWMKKVAQKYQDEGKMVIAMVHEEIMNHFTKQITVYGMPITITQQQAEPTSILNINYKHNPNVTSGDDATDVTLSDVQKAFADAGIHYVLTGHFHVHNAAKMNVTRTDGTSFELNDISTGSLTTYPNWMRTLTVDESAGTMTWTSSMLEMPLDDNTVDLQTKAKAALSTDDAKYDTYGFTISDMMKDFMATEPYELYDGTEMSQFTNDNGTITYTAYTFPSLKYTRTFNNNNWQALYVPFASLYSDWSGKFDIAIPDEGTSDALHFTTITDESEEIPANTIALIRLKGEFAPGQYSVYSSAKTDNLVTLVPGNTEKTISDYILNGTYSGMTGNMMTGLYALSGGALKTVSSSLSNGDNIFLNPMRWYLDFVTVSPMSSKPSSISVLVDDDTEATKISLVSDTLHADDKVYRIDGTQMKSGSSLPHGLYIINGKKSVK